MDKQNILELSSKVQTDEITARINDIFDFTFDGQITENIEVPTFPKEFQIGLIVGSSGSGKTKILHYCFGDEERIEWDNRKAIASNFSSFDEAAQLFGAVGLNSIPTWCKPYNVLSNGERFRADMARRLKDNAVIDEFTSVVNREVAISCSTSISKYIKRSGLKNIVFASCHDDIIPYLDPDWVYSTDEHTFYTGRYLRQPITIKAHPCDRSIWAMFKKYHYLSGDLNSSAKCFLGEWNERPIAFVAVLTFPSAVKNAYREHRLVVHPDFQGMGIGNRFSEMIAQAYVEKGCRYFSKTANVRVGEHRNNSPLWRATSHNNKPRHDYLVNGEINRHMKNRFCMSEEALLKHSQRVCYTHEYVGDGKKYPFTLDLRIGNSSQVDGQLNFFEELI